MVKLDTKFHIHQSYYCKTIGQGLKKIVDIPYSLIKVKLSKVILNRISTSSHNESKCRCEG
jgi:hypothetical protein